MKLKNLIYLDFFSNDKHANNDITNNRNDPNDPENPNNPNINHNCNFFNTPYSNPNNFITLKL